MKCIKCGKEYSYSVMPAHVKRCKAETKETVKDIKPVVEEKEVIENVELQIKSEEYTLEQLLQMALDNPNREHAPSTIKRWNKERLIKELDL